MRNNRWGYPAIFILAVIPLIIWLFMQPLGSRFGEASAVFRSIGQILSLVGVVLFSLTLLLNTRLRFLERYFGGQDKEYRAHHLTGTLAFVFILFHPVFLAVQYVPFSLRAAALFLLPGGDVAITLGFVALALMVILLFITFFVNLKYERWKFTHQFLGVAFIIAAFHVYFVSSDISRSLALRGYILAFIAIGILSYLYRTVLERWAVRTWDYQVEGVRNVGGKITEITLAPRRERMRFIPGQFLFVRFMDGEFGEVHPFTISSSPGEKNLRLSIKALGDYTYGLARLKLGTRARLEGPFGEFSYSLYREHPQIWIAGGIGIAPFLSMARSFRNEAPVDLYYCVNTPHEAVFLNELKGISSKHGKLRVFPYYSNSRGHINAEFIEKISGSLAGKEIFMCGPPGMITALRESFIKKGVYGRRVHSELFNLT